MRIFLHAFFSAFLCLASPSAALAMGCAVSGARSATLNDALFKALQAAPACPTNVHGLRAALAADGLGFVTAMVANRGFHNPGRGSFSFFEAVEGASRASGRVVGEGELFFGHFTAPAGQTLTLDQAPARGALMVELIAWDPAKRLFNFYEVIGDGTQGSWHYRGDSADIRADIAGLHRVRPAGTPPFGQRLRCSGCHLAGGPLMKEQLAPHNDWGRNEAPLPLGGRTPDASVAALLRMTQDASAFARRVNAGQRLIAATQTPGQTRHAVSLQEALRPLFCPIEVNFESDPMPHGTRVPATQLPARFALDPFLVEDASVPGIAIPRAALLQALQQEGSRFPETNLPDGQHPWLVPVKALSDVLAVRAAIASGLIDAEFAADVAAVDLGNPAFSTARCNLLRFVPNTQTPDWRARFAANLAAAAASAPAQEVHRNFADPTRHRAAHIQRARAQLSACQAKAEQPGLARSLLRLVAQRRAEVAASEISKNPRGQILEPGFRVIFPVLTNPATPGVLRLSESCDVVPVLNGTSFLR